MDSPTAELIDELSHTHAPSREGYRKLLEQRSEEAGALLAERARAQRRRIYGDEVFVRG